MIQQSLRRVGKKAKDPTPGGLAILGLIVAFFLFLLIAYFLLDPGAEILFLGDTGIGFGPGGADLERAGADAAFSDIRNLLKGSDYVIGSLCEPITARVEPAIPGTRGERFRQPPSAAAMFRDLGIDAFGLANRQVMDYGKEGLLDTLNALHESGIKTFGAGKDGVQAKAPLVIRKSGIRIGILACDQAETGSSSLFADENAPGIAFMPSKAIRKEIQRLKKETDAVVVFVHWGKPFTTVRKAQRQMADLFVKAGADLVIGHGPHRAQRIEIIENVPVIYSLGDFMFHGRREPRKKQRIQQRFSLAAAIRINRQGVKKIEMTPLLHSGREAGLRPAIAGSTEADALFPRLVWGKKRYFWHIRKNQAILDIACLRNRETPATSVSQAFTREFLSFFPYMFVFFFSIFFMGAASRFYSHQIRPWIAMGIALFCLVGAIVAGFYFAWQNKSLVDDSFITFRYVRNLLDGHGLVYNIGERVEGYTNFLWAILIAFFAWITGVDIPYIGFYASLVTFAFNLITIWMIGRKLSAGEPGQGFVPIAVVWLALQHSFHSFATTGMETMFAGWMVNLAAYFFLSPRRIFGSGFAGLFLILATLTRPDHAIFYVCMAAALLVRTAAELWKSRKEKERALNTFKAALAEAGAYALPFIGYLGYLLWKWIYYGSILPNTYYAKSTDLSYWSQGWLYTRISGLSMHLTVILPLFLIWLVHGRKRWDFKVFAGLSTLAYMLYVAKIGGDFMMGRFYISILPLMLLGIENLIHRVARSSDRKPAWMAIFLAALVADTFHGLQIVPPGVEMRGITDESSYYQVSQLYPLTIVKGKGTRKWSSQGELFKNTFKDKGMSPVVATGGIGMFGYYSELPIIDNRGLVDKYVAHRPLDVRGKPGHEKRPTATYWDARDVRFITRRGRPPEYMDFSIGGKDLYPWRIYRYDRNLMNWIEEHSPEFKFVRFPEYLDDHFESWKKLSGVGAATTLAEYDHFYFSLNEDPLLRRRFLDRFIRWWDFEYGMPEGTLVKGAFGQALVSPARDGFYSIERFQGNRCIATPAWPDKPETGSLTLPPFVVSGDSIGFKIGGGKESNNLYAVLYVEGQEVSRWTGNGDEILRFVSLNVAKYKGKTAQMVLFDHSQKGRLLFDMFYEAHNRLP